MSEIIGSLEKRLIATREKIKSRRREITGGAVEDKVKEMGKKTYDELAKDLDVLHQAAIEGKAKAGDVSHKLYDEITTDISTANFAICIVSGPAVSIRSCARNIERVRNCLSIMPA